MVIVSLTNGFGNNIFQYVAARQLAEFHNCELLAIPPSNDYYAIDELKSLGIRFLDRSLRGVFYEINDNNYREAFDEKLQGHLFVVSGYFEDYTLYEDNFSNIRSWFQKLMLVKIVT